jgi:hypothetical protein
MARSMQISDYFSVQYELIFKFYYLPFYWKIVKFKNSATFKKRPSLSVSDDLRYFLYTLLSIVILQDVD